jgi:uncharacterized protein
MEQTPVQTTELVSSPKAAPRGVAPIWHTLLFIAVLLVFSAGGTNSQNSLAVRYGRHWQYVATIAWEWILLLYVWWGMRLRGVHLRDVIGGKWERFEDFLLEVALAAGFWLAAILVLSGLGFAMGLSGSASKLDDVRKQLGYLVPRTNVELLLWLALSTTAGICEEIIFRGYLQKQFGGWLRSAWLGIIASGIVFGAAHGYQGSKRMLLIGVYGIMFGVLAHFRRSLRPGMMAHAFHDTFTGVMLRFLVK